MNKHSITIGNPSTPGGNPVLDLSRGPKWSLEPGDELEIQVKAGDLAGASLWIVPEQGLEKGWPVARSPEVSEDMHCLRVDVEPGRPVKLRVEGPSAGPQGAQEGRRFSLVPAHKGKRPKVDPGHDNDGKSGTISVTP